MAHPQLENVPSTTDFHATTFAQVTLRVATAVQDNVLVIEYEIQNGRSDAIYLVNRLFQWTRTGLSVDANLVYTEVTQGRLRLSKACLSVPEHIKVESPDVPYLTRLEAGEMFAEKLIFSLPLRPFHPYDQAKESEQVNVFDPIRFAVGWFAEGNLSVRQGSHPDGRPFLSADYGPVLREQVVLEVLLPVSVPAHIER